MMPPPQARSYLRIEVHTTMTRQQRQGPERESQDIQTMPIVISIKWLKIVFCGYVVYAALLYMEVIHCVIRNVCGAIMQSVLAILRCLDLFACSSCDLITLRAAV